MARTRVKKGAILHLGSQRGRVTLRPMLLVSPVRRSLWSSLLSPNHYLKSGKGKTQRWAVSGFFHSRREDLEGVWYFYPREKGKTLAEEPEEEVEGMYEQKTFVSRQLSPWEI